MLKFVAAILILQLLSAREKFLSSAKLPNSTGRPEVFVKPVNQRLFIPCFSSVCFKNLGCFQPFIIAAYISAPPLTVCPQDPEEMGVRFVVLSRGNYDKFESLSAIQPNSKVAFMIHGILSEYDTFIYLLPSYFLLTDYDHVVFVDWSIAADPYAVSQIPSPGLTFFVTHANVEVVGRMVCNVIHDVHRHRNVAMKDILLAGFSAGGNMIAFAAAYCDKRYELQVGRCTGKSA